MDSRYIINRKTAETDCNSQLSLEKQIFSSTGTSLLLILKVHERSCGIFKVMVTTTMSMCATVLQIMRGSNDDITLKGSSVTAKRYRASVLAVVK